MSDDPHCVLPRPVPEGIVPLIAVEGSAYECGRQYGRIVLERYPGYRQYLDLAWNWRRSLTDPVRRLLEDRCPQILEVHRGLAEVGGPGENRADGDNGGCTSFGLAGSATLDGQPISGQTKDTPLDSTELYIVLRMRITGAPTILVLCYPGEVLGYGLWSTGMSVFRNALYSTSGSPTGLTKEEWGFAALAGESVEEGVELAQRYGIAAAGNMLLSDPTGRTVGVEFNGGGVSVARYADGIATHTNHPLGDETAPFEHYPDEVLRDNSRYRAEALRTMFEAERGRLTPQRALMCLADHSRYPHGLCRHVISNSEESHTTAAVVAEPTRGRLHVVRGNPCCNWPVTYTV